MKNTDMIAEKVWNKVGSMNLKSLYLGGSRAAGSDTKCSDVDLFGIVHDFYNFDNEDNLNQELSEEFEMDIKFRGIAWSELQGGKHKGVLTKHVPLNVVLKSFNIWKHLKGKKYTLDDFEVEPATPSEEGSYYINRLKSDFDDAKSNNLPYDFMDYVKTTLLLIGVEEQLDGYSFTIDYNLIKVRAEGDSEKLAERCMNYRKKGKIDSEAFFQDLDDYLTHMEQKLDA